MSTITSYSIDGIIYTRTSGLLEINEGIERQLGVDPGFWVAVALAYLEFLTERDSYLVAANG
ncbi:hypothetical protein JB92DRAFT_3126859 [Gautieria morchelliformis]|nr:hypothetical protein JB92DRAFT_3126859 [Gautieria morchelliformis]